MKDNGDPFALDKRLLGENKKPLKPCILCAVYLRLALLLAIFLIADFTLALFTRQTLYGLIAAIVLSGIVATYAFAIWTSES